MTKKLSMKQADNLEQVWALEAELVAVEAERTRDMIRSLGRGSYFGTQFQRVTADKEGISVTTRWVDGAWT